MRPVNALCTLVDVTRDANVLVSGISGSDDEVIKDDDEAERTAGAKITRVHVPSR